MCICRGSLNKIVNNYCNRVALDGNLWTWSFTSNWMQTPKFKMTMIVALSVSDNDLWVQLRLWSSWVWCIVAGRWADGHDRHDNRRSRTVTLTDVTFSLQLLSLLTPLRVRKVGRAQMLSRKSGCLTEVSRDFLQSLQTNDGILPQIMLRPLFFPHLLLLIVY
jgi:hypothetical protein